MKVALTRETHVSHQIHSTCGSYDFLGYDELEVSKGSYPMRWSCCCHYQLWKKARSVAKQRFSLNTWRTGMELKADALKLRTCALAAIGSLSLDIDSLVTDYLFIIVCPHRRSTVWTDLQSVAPFGFAEVSTLLREAWIKQNWLARRFLKQLKKWWRKSQEIWGNNQGSFLKDVATW